MRKKMQELRLKRNMTQQEVADVVGISRSYYTNIERGEYTPSLSKALAIKKALNYKKDDIFLISNVHKTDNNK